MTAAIRTCMMPGCDNEVESGRLCDSCKSGGQGYAYPIIGVSPEVQPHLRKKKKPVWNKKPREIRTCACGCGQRFQAKVDSKKKYYNVSCMHRGHRGTKPEKYPVSPEIDEQIIEIYQNRVGIESTKSGGSVAELAHRTGLPRWKITRRAIQLGLIQHGPRLHAFWEAREVEILRQNARFTPLTICRKLREAGFARSENAVKVKLTRMGGSDLIDGFYSARAAAEKFGVDARTVLRWIELGYFPAQRKGTARTELQGGDEWVIARDDLRRFVINLVAIVDFRKINKFWLVELLTGKELKHD